MQSKVALDLSVGKSKNNMLRTQLNQQQELIASLQEQLHESKHARIYRITAVADGPVGQILARSVSECNKRF